MTVSCTASDTQRLVGRKSRLLCPIWIEYVEYVEHEYVGQYIIYSLQFDY